MFTPLKNRPKVYTLALYVLACISLCVGPSTNLLAQEVGSEDPAGGSWGGSSGVPGLEYGTLITVEEMERLIASTPYLHCLGRAGICFCKSSGTPGGCGVSGDGCSAGVCSTSVCPAGDSSGTDPSKLLVEIVPCFLSKSPDAFASHTGSYVDNTFYTYDHASFDAPNVEGSPLSLQRFHRSRDFFKAGSFGRGVLCNFDLRLSLDGEDITGSSAGLDEIGYRWASLIVPNSSVKFNFEHVADTTFPPGFDYYHYTHNRLVPTQRSRAEKLEIFDSEMQPVTGEYRDSSSSTGPPIEYPGAAFAKLTLWEGAVYLFELVRAEPVPSGATPAVHPPNGRLIQATTRSSVGYTITYKSWTQTEIDESPSRLWQIDTVTDHAGNSFEFEYASQQVGGCWVISEVTLPDDEVIEYRYAGGFLSEVEYPDSTISTISYEAESSGLIKINFHDMAAEPRQRHKTVYVSGSVGTSGGTVVPTSVGMARMVTNGEDEVVYGNSAQYGNNEPVNGAVYGMIYEGGGRAFGELHSGSIGSQSGFIPRRYYKSGWTFEEGEDVYGNPGPEVFSGTLETNYSLYAGSSVNVSNGQPNRVIDDQGLEIVYHYDDAAPGRPHIRTDYTDGTFETYCYNSQRQVIRYRDRKGHVTRSTYDTLGHKLTEEVGLIDNPSTVGNDPYYGSNYNRCATNDDQTADYAVTEWQYFPTGQNGAGQVAKVIDPLGNETDYEYDAQHRRTKVLAPAESTNGTRPETVMTYDSQGRLQTVTDPLGHQVEYFYDFRHRRISTLYDDGSSERTIYGTTGSTAGLVAKTIDRNGVVTSYDYDGADRLISKTIGSGKVVGGNEVATPETASTETFAYIPGTNDLLEVRSDAKLTQYAYDYRGRRVATRQVPRANQQLITRRVYLQNKLFSSEDPYGRKTYFAYDATDGRLIRTVTGTTPEFVIEDFDEVINLIRDDGPNADYVINDSVFDASGNLVESYDPRLVKTEHEYDSRDREVVRLAAAGSTIEAKTETVYDAASNVVEVRSPRYFVSADTHGYQKAKETWTFNGRNLVGTHTEAPGTSETATESFTYDLANRRLTHTDFNGKLWKTHYDDCCGKVVSSENPLGHGTITRKDAAGRTVHQISVADYDDHNSALDDPVDGKTLREITTKYDGRGRPVARTTWLVACGTVDVADPPIAGLGSFAADDGLTEQFLYDDNLADDDGLDSSSGADLLIGSGSVSLSEALTKLADTQANGGAGITFVAFAAGSARATISPTGEVSFSISDATGRSVMSGMVQPPSDSNAGDLITWSCTKHDATASLSGYGTVLETASINALGKTRKSLTEAVGRTLRSLDELGKITSYTFDAAGNQLSVTDPNGVGQTCVYDALSRDMSCTDTEGSVTQSVFDAAGNKIASTDAKNQTTSDAFDARGRQKTQTDRLAGVTAYAYTPGGQLASLTDAESQVTSYTYNDVGSKVTETYPDHVTNSTIGQTTYGKIIFTYDAVGRTLVRTDQQGDTCTYNYDLAGRLASRAYAGHSSGPLTGVTDSDTFTYDDSSRMLTAVSGRYSNTVTYTYDTAGRKVTEALTIGGQTYTATSDYDAVGQVSKLTYPDGTEVTRGYSDRGQLATIGYDSTTIDTRTYDDGGRMTSSAYNNGVSESRTYNDDNTLAGISFSGASIGNLSYTWDENKNKTAEGISGTMSSYGFAVGSSGYDDEDRLVNWERADSALDQAWDLSLVGDWDSFTENSSTQTRTHGPTHELLTAASQSVTHDAKGNMTLIPAALRGSSQTPTQPLKMKWDFENKLISADIDNDNTHDVFYKFDALGRRVARTATSATVVYFQSGQQTIADYPSGTAASSPTYTYVYASYIDEPVMRTSSGGSVKHYYHRNQQYSVTALTDGSGAVVERYAYSAYGTPTITDASGTVQTSSACNNRNMYTGREWDADLRLYHYRARIYDSLSGRFCSRDPIGYEGSPWNMYEYVKGDPLRFTDPTGLDCKLVGPDGPVSTSGTSASGVYARPGLMLHPGAKDIMILKNAPIQCCTTKSQDFGYSCCCGWNTKSGLRHTETRPACFTLPTNRDWLVTGYAITVPGIQLPVNPAFGIYFLDISEKPFADQLCQAAARAGLGTQPKDPVPPKTLPCP